MPAHCASNTPTYDGYRTRGLKTNQIINVNSDLCKYSGVTPFRNRMKAYSRKLACAAAILFVCSAAFLWFHTIPRKFFSLGMSLSEIEKNVGGHCDVIPLGSAFSDPPTEFELANTPRYQVRVAAMAVDIYLNSHKKAVCIQSLFGTEGELTLTVPSRATNSTNGP